jgi:hypothetical protein
MLRARGSALIGCLLVSALALQCHSESGPAQRSELRQEPASGAGEGVLASLPSVAPGAATCPADHPVPCPERCCLPGTTCAAALLADGGLSSDGGCVLAPSAACPTSAPVLCTGALTGDGGFTSLDESGHAAHAHLVAPASFGEGRGSAALDLPASWPNGCAVPASANVQLQGGQMRHTLSAWVRSDGGAGTHTIAALSVLSGTATLTQLGITGGVLSLNTCRGAAVPPGWHLVAASYDPAIPDGGQTALGAAALYLDGADAGTCFLGGTFSPLYLGTVTFGVAPGQCGPFSGQIDEVRFETGALTAPNAQADFAAAHLPLTPTTQGLWRFDEGAPARCCPAGSTCDPGGVCADKTVAPACPATAPQACNSYCCPSDATCTAQGCVVPGPSVRCGGAAPTACGDGTCCATALCTAAACIADTGAAPPPACKAGELAVRWGQTSDFICCPAPPTGAAGLSWAKLGADNYCMLGLACPANACPAGYGCNPGTQTCAALATSTGTCAGAGPFCAGDSAHASGCCPAGGACQGPGVCCAAGESPCGTGCAPTGQCSTPTAGTCSTGWHRCGDECCLEFRGCATGGGCLAEAAGKECASGITCGQDCCAAGSVCLAGACVREPVAPIACAAGTTACSPLGPCCPSGFACAGSIASGFSCLDTAAVVGRGGPAGPPCNGGFCPTGDLCTAGACCPADHPDLCGAVCCQAGACFQGQCGCPMALSLRCGERCCPFGGACAGDQCSAVCVGPESSKETVCGADCCGPGVPCVGGKCVCPEDHPVACGDDCCLPGAPCTASVCGCPPGRASCGDLCCGESEECSGGVCGSGGGGGGGSCPGGWLGSGASCAPLGSGGSCKCNFTGSTNVCITKTDYESATGLPFPAACTPEGSGGCLDTSTGTLVRPCCPGLTCTVGAVCAQSPALSGGTCQKR